MHVEFSFYCRLLFAQVWLLAGACKIWSFRNIDDGKRKKKKKKRIIQFSDFAKVFKQGRNDDNGERRGMSTSREDEMIIDLSQNDNWVKAKIYIEIKCYN